MRQQIWRLENANGDGPFEGFNKLKDEEEKKRLFYAFPDAVGWTKVVIREGFFSSFETWYQPPDHPHHDTDIGRPYAGDAEHHWKVGTKDRDQFLHWFPPKSFDFFSELGFELVIYECECSYIKYGTYQLLFCVEDAVLVERKALHDV
jgi:hypothetical protein